MLNKIVAVFACFGFAASAGAAEVDFDKGTDVNKIVEESVSKDYYPYDNYPHDGYTYNGYTHEGYPYNGYPSPHHVRYTRDCETFSFGAGEYPMNSGVEYLESIEYAQECHYVPDPPPPPKPPKPNNPGHPNPGHPNPGHHKVISLEKSVSFDLDILDTDVEGVSKAEEIIETTSKGMVCHERPGTRFQRTVRLNLGARKLLPWERDVFKVCLEGPRMDIRMIEAAYSYNISRYGDYDVRFDLTPLYKVATRPDENGLYSTGFSYNNGKFTLDVADRWGQEYAGEKVMIKVELYKDGFLFFNSFKGDKEFIFNAARGYQLVFAENELDASKSVTVPEELTKGPKKYYVKWGFERMGNLSTREYINKGSTDKIEVK